MSKSSGREGRGWWRPLPSTGSRGRPRCPHLLEAHFEVALAQLGVVVEGLVDQQLLVDVDLPAGGNPGGPASACSSGSQPWLDQGNQHRHPPKTGSVEERETPREGRPGLLPDASPQGPATRTLPQPCTHRELPPEAQGAAMRVLAEQQLPGQGRMGKGPRRTCSWPCYGAGSPPPHSVERAGVGQAGPRPSATVTCGLSHRLLPLPGPDPKPAGPCPVQRPRTPSRQHA